MVSTISRGMLGLGLLLALAGSAAAQTTLPATLPAAMPPGHPSLEQMMAAGAASQPATTAPDLHGTLTLSVVQGSAGGPAIGATKASITLYHRGAALKQLDVELDAQGHAELTDLPVNPPVQPMVSIEHAGLLQQGLGPVLDAAHPSQKIEMKVYETTDQKPAWSVAMRHMIVDYEGALVHVTEMLSVTSPADRIWRGEPMGDRTVTIALPLPAGAKDVQLDAGFDTDLTEIAKGMLVTASPLFPGRNEVRFSYTLAATAGKVGLSIAAPVPVGSLMVFLPADQTKVTATGLEGGDVMSMGDHSVRVYKEQNLPAGARADLEISGLAAAPTGLAPAVNKSALSPKNLALAGGFLVVLVGAGLLLRKPRKAT
jgi:hypothetical protein